MTNYGRQTVQAVSADMKDPMTVYAKHAAKVEEAEEAVEGKQVVSIKEANMTPPLAALTDEEERIEKATRKAKQHSGGLKIFSGNGNLPLSLEISRHLGINLGKATVGRFADGEINVVIHENVRGKDCYVIQPTCPPVNDNIMELLLMVSTLNRASARRITVVIPYYGYARQDRKMQVRDLLMATSDINSFHR
jgi:ribose-phosphate pyrophosphokinase